MQKLLVIAKVKLCKVQMQFGRFGQKVMISRPRKETWKTVLNFIGTHFSELHHLVASHEWIS